jgi:hypothetical protein
MYLKGIGREGVGWIHLLQVRVQWQAVVNMVMNFVLHKILGIS